MTVFSDALHSPRLPALGIGTLLAVSLAMAVVSRFTGPVSSAPPPSASIGERDLRFVDMSNGGVDVIDAATGQPIDIVAPGTNGFLRGLMRGFSRERRIADLGSAAPYRLTAWADGRITLDDVKTGQRVDLEAFGPTNAAVFANFLTPNGKSAKNGAVSQ